jgi:hypothetical protein
MDKKWSLDHIMWRSIVTNSRQSCSSQDHVDTLKLRQRWKQHNEESSWQALVYSYMFYFSLEYRLSYYKEGCNMVTLSCLESLDGVKLKLRPPLARRRPHRALGPRGLAPGQVWLNRPGRDTCFARPWQTAFTAQAKPLGQIEHTAQILNFNPLFISRFHFNQFEFTKFIANLSIVQKLWNQFCCLSNFMIYPLKISRKTVSLILSKFPLILESNSFN